MLSERKLLNSLSGPLWERIGIRHHHGIVAPLFCLRSKNSCGIGEYTDLLPLIKWCTEIGFDIIQLLPINDTGIHPSPYAALSAFALNPVFLGLTYLPNVSNHPELLKRIAELQEMTKSKRVDYKTVYRKKNLFLRLYYVLEGKAIIESKEFYNFTCKHDWLNGFALFKVLKEKNKWIPFKEWKPNPDPELYKEEMMYHKFVQFLCFEQMHQIEQIALENGVLLMGDIPILIGRESADVWEHSNLFHLQYSAGAPPDAFAKNGQIWGFPIYNWNEIEKQNYKWWKKRLEVASLFFDVYRIDHIVGFFRIWAVPKNMMGRDGFYIPLDHDTWLDLGKQNLTMMLGASDMFPIGEDLGMIPANVHTCLKELGIPGMKIMRWERSWVGDNPYIPFDQYPELSMTTVTTHDMEPLIIWWKNNPEEVETFCKFMGWEYSKELSEEMHKQILLESHRTTSLFHINLLQEYLSLFPELRWSNPRDEQINTPGTISTQNWSNRLRPWLEEMTAHEGLGDVMKEMSSAKK